MRCLRNFYLLARIRGYPPDDEKIDNVVRNATGEMGNRMVQFEARTLDLFSKMSALQEQKSNELLTAIHEVRKESAQIQNEVTNLLGPIKNDIEEQKKTVEKVCREVEKQQKDTREAFKTVCQRMRKMESTPCVKTPELTHVCKVSTVPENVRDTFDAHANEITILHKKILSLETQSVGGAQTFGGPVGGPCVGTTGAPVTDHVMGEGGEQFPLAHFFPQE